MRSGCPNALGTGLIRTITYPIARLRVLSRSSRTRFPERLPMNHPLEPSGLLLQFNLVPRSTTFGCLPGSLLASPAGLWQPQAAFWHTRAPSGNSLGDQNLMVL